MLEHSRQKRKVVWSLFEEAWWPSAAEGEGDADMVGIGLGGRNL
jgi:hypothetical protein